MNTRVLILLICLIGSAVAVARADRSERPPHREVFAGFPMQIGKWQGLQQPPFTARVLEVLGVDDYLTRVYLAPANAETRGNSNRAGVGLYIGYWESQRQGDTIHSPQNCLPGAGWEPVSQGMVDIPDPRAPQNTIRLNRYVVQKGLERQLVLYWYQSHGRVVASEYWGKIYMVVDAVRTNRTDGSIVRVIAPFEGDNPDAQAKAQELAIGFVQDLMPKLDPFLPL